MPLTVGVDLSARDRDELLSWMRSPSIKAGLVQRARVVLLAAEGVGKRGSLPAHMAWHRRMSAAQALIRCRIAADILLTPLSSLARQPRR